MRPPSAPLVAVLLGTDHHRFDRLLAWLVRLEEQRLFRFHVQHGSTPLPSRLEGAPLLAPVALGGLLDRACAVVAHGGPGSIMDAREHGHVPVVVPRDPRRGEHVDDHQLRFARFLAGTGLVSVATEEHQLATRLSLAVVARPQAAAVRTPSPTLARFEALVEELVHR